MLGLVLLCAFWPSDAIIEEQFHETERTVAVKSVIDVGRLDPKLRDDILGACEQAVGLFQDPVFRRDMTEIVQHIKDDEWVFQVINDKGPLPGDQYSGARLGDDGRPTINIYTPLLERDFNAARRRHPDREVRVSMKTLLVLLVLHEGRHIFERHIFEKGVPLEKRVVQESLAWRYTVEHGLLPAQAAGRLPQLPIPLFAHAGAAFQHSDPTMWPRFMDVIAVPGGEHYNAFVADLYGDE